MQFVLEPAYAKSNYWLNAIRLKDSDILDAVLKETNNAGFMTRPVWDLISGLPMYTGNPSMEVPTAKKLAASIINLPSGCFLVE